jgi:hypothetical protein
LKKKELEKLPIEVRFVPLSKEDLERRQKKLELLLFKGAKKASNE